MIGALSALAVHVVLWQRRSVPGDLSAWWSGGMGGGGLGGVSDLGGWEMVLNSALCHRTSGFLVGLALFGSFFSCGEMSLSPLCSVC